MTKPKATLTNMSAEDPHTNKTIVSATGVVILVGLRWATSGELNLDDEGLIVLAGALTTLGVYFISNLKRMRDALRRN